MNVILILTIAIFMAAMGVSACIAPVRFLRFVGSEPLGRDGRNEVRAVYGGFGLMMCVLLIYAVQESAYRPGILLCVGLALVGMALGRVVSAILDRGISPFMIAILSGEMAGGAVLLFTI